MTLKDQQQREARYLMSTYGRKPVEFVRGQGMELFDSEGRRYLDFLAGIGAVSVGHCHPAVSSALASQVQTLLHVGNYFYVPGRGELAQRLDGLLSGASAADTAVACAAPATAAPAPASTADAADTSAAPATASAPARWRTFFANSGTEAVEGAIKIARKHGRQNLNGAYTILTAQRSFHGRTMGALAATGQSVKQDSFTPMPQGFKHLPFNDLFALTEALEDTTAPACAVLLECIQGEGGVWPHSPEYLQAVRAETEKRGLALLIDEVQTGFFRTGKTAFAFVDYGIVPDVVTLAKGLGNGMPIGAVCARGNFGELLEPGEHGSTFGGSPLAIAAANATLDVLCSGSLPDAVEETGAYLRERLATLPQIKELRGKGLMIGADLDAPQAPSVVDAALEAGFVLNATGPQTLRFLPPLICEKSHVDELITALDPILKGLK
ncbi:MAG: acetylornithine/succinylornithine family transaminase [Coriobacteriales bacterium]|jgi:acetylornithine aminotransferase|nr:acetylornithine/succinylornithine family transaminase [Coriobacteriales bacterium]